MSSPVPPRRAAPSARRRSTRRRQRVLGGVVVGAVLVIIATLVVVGTSSSSRPTPARLASPAGTGTGTSTAGATATTVPPVVPTGPAPAAVIAAVTSIPLVEQRDAARSTSVGAPSKIGGARLTADGTPVVLYIGAEYCPYCAAERWAVVSSLAHFGTWSGLQATASAADDTNPDTPTLSFHGATFTSPYIRFQAVEESTNQPCTPGAPGCASNGYGLLDQPTAEQQHLLDVHDSRGSIPFVDIGGTSVLVGASYDPTILAGQSVADVAAQLQHPGSTDARSIDAAAEAFTRAVCTTTGGEPVAVCAGT